jgi:hypothetical protein
LVGRLRVRSRPFLAVVTQQRQYSLFKTLYLVGWFSILHIVVLVFCLSLGSLIQIYPYVFRKPLE